MMLKTEKVKMVEKYFISPRGYVNVIPVLHGTHISEVIKNPKAFGLTQEIIAEIYLRHTETIPKEGYAREQILTELLEKGWIRARLKQGYLYCQIGFESKRIYKNILKLVTHLKLVHGMQKHRVLGLRVYIVSESWLIDAYDAQEAKKRLYEKIKYEVSK